VAPSPSRPAATLSAVRWFGGYPGFPDGEELGSIELSARFTPRTSGTHEFTVGGHGNLRLQVAGETLHSGPVYPTADGSAAILVPSAERRRGIHLTAGVPVQVSVVQLVQDHAEAASVVMTLGHADPGVDPDEMLDEAVRVAADADVAVVVVGTTEEVESEGFDRTSLTLPGRQDELVARVAAANSRTVVVVYAGAPVLMPWADDVAAILLAWFGGQEAGAALAEVLLGMAEPGGRLPTTWPRREEDCPVRTVVPTDGVLAYDEGVFIGYRAWERVATAALFPFGHGLGYTTWSYERLAVEPGEGLGTAVVTLRNTGHRRGRETVQVYVGPEADDPDRPRRWLAGFAVTQAAPGETVTVRVPLPERTIQIWDDGWRTMPGAYRVEAARSIADRPLSTIVTSWAERCFPGP
jgi:beta-glucosidase